MIQKIEESSKYLKKQGIENGAIGIILGTGLSDLVNCLVIEKEISKADLLSADEIFLSNSIYNIRWVAAIENTNYTNNIIFKVVDTLQRKETEVFC